MIQIKSAVLHVFDFAHDHLGLSEQMMPDEDLRQLTFARKQVERLIDSPILKSGEFLPESHRKNDFEKYGREEMGLLELSTIVAQEWYRLIKMSDKIDPSSLLCLDVYDNAKHLAVFLKYKTKNGYMYTTKSVDGKTYEGIVENMSLLPNSTQSVDECFIIDVDNLSIKYKDTVRVIESQETSVISDRLLFCTSNLSQKEIITTINHATEDMCESYEMDSLSHVAKSKAYIQEKLTEDGYLRLNELAADVFEENQSMQQEFVQNLTDLHVPSDTFMHQSYAQSASKTQKIKTDTGIEMLIPSIYFDDPEHFEIIQNEDSTITIQIKNVLFVK